MVVLHKCAETPKIFYPSPYGDLALKISAKAHLFANTISVWTWNDKCLIYAFMLALMASDDGFGWYGLSKCINICTCNSCMHSNEKEHRANADQRHMSLPEPGRHMLYTGLFSPTVVSPLYTCKQFHPIRNSPQHSCV